MNRIELIMRRRVIRQFINADPVNIELFRNGDPEKSPAGGWIKTAPRSIAPQTARIILNKRRYNKGINNVEAGEILHTDYLLVAVHTTDVEVEDEFTWLGQWYKVTSIYVARTESVLASIDLLGGPNRR